MFHFFGPSSDDSKFKVKLRHIDARWMSGDQHDAALFFQDIATLCANYGEYEHKKLKDPETLVELFYITRNSLLNLGSGSQVQWPHFESILSVQPKNKNNIDPDTALGNLWRVASPSKFDVLDTRWKKRIRALTPDPAARRGIVSLDGVCYTGPAGGASGQNPIAFYDPQLPRHITLVAETIDLDGDAIQIVETETPDRMVHKLAARVAMADIQLLSDFSNEAQKILMVQSKNHLDRARMRVTM
jgi:hypothetical protein